MKAKPWTCTFILLNSPTGEKYVVLTGEYKHGHERISITPPAGVPEKDESMTDCAKREAEQESGLILESVQPLCGPLGEALSGRKSTELVFPFLGIPAYDTDGTPKKKPVELDETENLKCVLMPLEEYWKFIGTDYENESGPRDCGYAALRELGLLTLAG